LWLSGLNIPDKDLILLISGSYRSEILSLTGKRQTLDLNLMKFHPVFQSAFREFPNYNICLENA
jgi:hypothetical protein